MKKKLIMLLLSGILGIGSTVNVCADENKEARIKEIQTQIKQLQDELAELQKETEDGEAEKAVIGTEIVKDGFAKITMKDVSYQTVINPSDTSGVYTYYEVKNPGNIFLACHFDFTNLQTQAGSSLGDFLTLQATYEGGYEYEGWSLAEVNGYLDQYPNLLPLSTYDSWYLIEVPESLQDTPYELTLEMDGTTYQVVEEND